MPARPGVPQAPRPNAGRLPELTKAAHVLRERVSHWLANDARAARVDTEALSALLGTATEITALVTAELDRRADAEAD